MDISVYAQVKTALTGASLTKQQAKELIDLIVSGIDNSTQNTIPFHTKPDDNALCELCGNAYQDHWCRDVGLNWCSNLANDWNRFNQLCIVKPTDTSVNNVLNSGQWAPV